MLPTCHCVGALVAVVGADLIHEWWKTLPHHLDVLLFTAPPLLVAGAQATWTKTSSHSSLEHGGFALRPRACSVQPRNGRCSSVGRRETRSLASVDSESGSTMDHRTLCFS